MELTPYKKPSGRWQDKRRWPAYTAFDPFHRNSIKIWSYDWP